MLVSTTAFFTFLMAPFVDLIYSYFSIYQANIHTLTPTYPILCVHIIQVLVQDVRSVHQGRGLASNELYECCFDNVVMFFVTTEDEMRVVSAE